MVLIVGISVAVAVVVAYLLRHILGGMVGFYRVVPVNETHIRVLQNTKSVFVLLPKTRPVVG